MRCTAPICSKRRMSPWSSRRSIGSLSDAMRLMIRCTRYQASSTLAVFGSASQATEDSVRRMFATYHTMPQSLAGSDSIRKPRCDRPLAPAEIFGVADRIGSIQVGKEASLFLADGDILETSTQVEKAWIQGRKVDLSSRHTDLYDKYRTKYEQLKN